MRKSKGFTLIELLVVIAIIGILAAIVLVSLSGAKNKAKDVRITAGMGQLRTTAEIVNDTNGNYGQVLVTGGNADVATLAADMNAQNGTGTDLVINPAAPSIAYCAYIQMNTGYWCVDSTLASKKCTSTPAVAGGCMPTTTFVCPVSACP